MKLVLIIILSATVSFGDELPPPPKECLNKIECKCIVEKSNDWLWAAGGATVATLAWGFFFYKKNGAK